MRPFYWSSAQLKAGVFVSRNLIFGHFRKNWSFVEKNRLKGETRFSVFRGWRRNFFFNFLTPENRSSSIGIGVGETENANCKVPSDKQSFSSAVRWGNFAFAQRFSSVFLCTIVSGSEPVSEIFCPPTKNDHTEFVSWTRGWSLVLKFISPGFKASGFCTPWSWIRSQSLTNFAF